MELLQLTYFCHAAKCENFSKTAEYYNVPTSNISRAVRSLEKELNTKLFKRTANKIFLNDKGKIFYQAVNQALNSLENGKKAILGDKGNLSGEIKLLICTCRRIATQAIEQFRQSYPDFKFLIKHGVENGNYDFVISDIPPSKKDYNKIQLMTEKMLLAIPKASPLFNVHDAISQIESAPFISLGAGTRLHSLTEQFCNTLGFTPKIELQTDDPYYVRKYLEMGLGVAVFPEKSWAQMISPEIKLYDAGFPMRKNYVFMEKDKKLSSAEKAFLEILVSTFKKA